MGEARISRREVVRAGEQTLRNLEAQRDLFQAQQDGMAKLQVLVGQVVHENEKLDDRLDDAETDIINLEERMNRLRDDIESTQNLVIEETSQRIALQIRFDNTWGQRLYRLWSNLWTSK